MSKAQRAVRIELNERKYLLIATERSTTELHSGDGSTLVRAYRPVGLKPDTVTLSTDADATDLVVALATFALNTDKLTTTRAVVGGVLKVVFGTGGGEGS